MIRAALIFLALAGPAYGQGNCAAQAIVTSRLSEKFNETRKAWRVADGRLWEVYASDEDGTWTLIVTTGWKWTCIIRAGHGWTPPPGLLV